MTPRTENAPGARREDDPRRGPLLRKPPRVLVAERLDEARVEERATRDREHALLREVYEAVQSLNTAQRMVAAATTAVNGRLVALLDHRSRHGLTVTELLDDASRYLALAERKDA